MFKAAAERALEHDPRAHARFDRKSLALRAWRRAFTTMRAGA